MSRNAANINTCVWEDWLSAQRAVIPPLLDVKILSPRVIRILGGNPGPFQLQGTNTYLVGMGEKRILPERRFRPTSLKPYADVSQGKKSWIDNLVGVLGKHHLSISHVLLTHWHGDHTGGVPDLLSSDNAVSVSEDDVYKNSPDAGQQPIHDGQVFSVPGATLRAVHTPGHAEDHCCFVLDEENALFTGDNVLGHGYSVEEDLAAYMESLGRMRDCNCTIGYPAHGDVIMDLPKTIRLYIRHIEARESLITRALKKTGSEGRGQGGTVAPLSRGRTVADLVFELHGNLPEEIMKMALLPAVGRILEKLAQDKKVGFRIAWGVKHWFLMM
ncbi:metallo-beta-lactamase superfamily protein [Microsporum canis CBS 113480]|uniref:Lactamase-like protein nscB n=1 Tax=Arthroderma otae (strain ATCC MYA-4605 / CBS 113480) TaxID=554155 RepID=C5FNL1_ARTOC|nr:metallo-beta-lactamase superfamily protein [Microsporum canis CBS 113480]EEQ31625.1 metallo-beta-lactamase superfamily protein [Microsporum canis CBS 113480]